MVVSCCVLHNIAEDRGLPREFPGDDDQDAAIPVNNRDQGPIQATANVRGEVGENEEDREEHMQGNSED